MRHALLTRSFIAVLLLFSFLPWSHAAVNPLDTMPLSRALDRLAETTGISIVYSTDTVTPGMRVALPANVSDIESILHGWLGRWDLEFEYVHDVIVIRSLEDRVELGGAIVGRILNANTKAPLGGMRIQTANGEASATSAENGTFLMKSLEQGNYRLMLNSRGWYLTRPVEITIDASGIGFALVTVIEGTYPLDEIVISPSFYELDATKIDTSIRLGSEDLLAAPKLGGEVLRAISYLPGVMQGGASARTHLRGGVANETLYLFDGIRLYDPFHLRDFLAPFSILDAQRISSANIRVGAYPAMYGNRLSGVIEFEPIAAYAQFGGEVETNVFHTGFLLSDSFADASSAWVVSLRRGHLDLLLDAFDVDSGTPTYLDSYARLEHETDGGLRLSASYLGARDRLLINTTDHEQSARADYDNNYYWVRAHWSPTGNFEITTTLSNTVLNTSRTGTADRFGEFSGSVQDRSEADIQGFSTDLLWRATPRLRMKSGLGYETREVEFDYRADRKTLGPVGAYGDNDNFVRIFNGAFAGTAKYAYVELRAQINESLNTDIGLRVDQQSYPANGETQVSPRLGLAWEINEKSVVRLSAGRYWQAMGLEELPVEDGITQYVTPERADNIVAGLDMQLRPYLLFRTELYVKKISDPWARWENLLGSRSLVPELESDRVMLAPSSSRVRGLEASLVKEKAQEKSTWWITVSVARATDRIDGDDVARSWNQQWQLGAGVQWPWGNWTIEAIARAASGFPITPLYLEPSSDPPVLRMGDVNSKSLSTTHGLDLRVSREWHSGENHYTFYIEAINAYSGPNECCINYSIAQTKGVYSLRRQSDKWYGVVPNIGFRWRF